MIPYVYPKIYTDAYFSDLKSSTVFFNKKRYIIHYHTHYRKKYKASIDGYFNFMFPIPLILEPMV